MRDGHVIPAGQAAAETLAAFGEDTGDGLGLAVTQARAVGLVEAGLVEHKLDFVAGDCLGLADDDREVVDERIDVQLAAQLSTTAGLGEGRIVVFVVFIMSKSQRLICSKLARI